MGAQGSEKTAPDLGGAAFRETALDRSAPARPSGPMPERGSEIGRFVLLDELGSGGMGVVYAAYDPNLDRKVAIKLLRVQAMESEEARLRLLREAQAMARIDHPNVLRVYEAGTFGNHIYIAMEFASAGTLRQWLAASPRSTREILGVFIQAGRGLAAAHDAGLVHRDFKPDNVLMLADDRARVTDFGLVGVVGEQAPARPRDLEGPISDTTPLSQDLTRTGALMGTPGYMAPEQFKGGIVGPAADQFAFCVALYEALYKTRPFAGDTFAELCANVTTGTVSAAPPRDAVPSRIRRVLLRGLSVDATKRYPSLTTLLAELDSDSKRRRAWRLGLAGASVVAAGGIGLMALSSRSSEVCSGADQRVATFWNAATKARLAQAFAATKRPDARAVLDRTMRMIDGWAEAWQGAYVGACEDTHVREIQSEQLLDLRMDCLSRELSDASMTLDVLGKGGGDAVDNAITTVRGLPPLIACSDTAALSAGVAPPATEAQGRAATAIRAKLAEARAQRAIGHYAVALSIANGALAEAKTAGYPPALAEAVLEVGTLQSFLRQRSAADTLGEATRGALQAGDTELAILGAGRWLSELSDQPPRFAVGDEMGKLAEAIAAHRPVTARTMVSLHIAIGDLLRSERHVDKAQARYDQALALATKELGADAPETLKTLQRMAVLATDRHRYEDAHKLFERVLAADERVFGPDHPDYASALENLANNMSERGKTGEGMQMRERALAIRLAALGPDHPAVASSYDGLGGMYEEAGDHEKAKSYFEKALAMETKAYGEDSIELATPLTNLGLCLNAMGDAKGARAALERARVLHEKAYPADDPRVAGALSNLGIVERDQKHFDEAVALFRRAEEIASKAYGPNDSHVIDYRGNLASTYTLMGKLPEAREATLRTMTAMSETWGPDSPPMGAALGNYGFLQIQMKDPKGALESFQKAQKIFEAKLGPKHPNTAFVLVGAAQSLILLHREAEAVPALERSLEIGNAAHIQPVQLAEIHDYLAQAFAANPTMRARARAEMKTAADLYADGHQPAEAAKARAWLQKH